MATVSQCWDLSEISQLLSSQLHKVKQLADEADIQGCAM